MSDDLLDPIAQVRREIAERASEAAAKADADRRERESWRCRHAVAIGVERCVVCEMESIRTAKMAP